MTHFPFVSFPANLIMFSAKIYSKKHALKKKIQFNEMFQLF